MSIDPRVASGLRDVPPSVMIPRERMLETFRKTFASFGFVPIETPHIERMEVLTGKGAGSDEVLRQIFEVTNKGGTRGELALRFDLTVPLARFVARHVNELGTPFKRYAIGSVFRGERPAKGRFREFMQCDFDTVGTESAVADAETAQVIYETLSAAGVPAFTITLNNRLILDGFLDSLGLLDEFDSSRLLVTKEFKLGHIMRSIDKRDKLGPAGLLNELMTRFKRDWVHHPDKNSPDPDEDTPKYELVRANEDQQGRLETSSEDQEVTPKAASIISEAQARKIADFVEQAHGGLEILSDVEKTLNYHQKVVLGIANLRVIFDLLSAAGVPETALRIDLGLARGLDYYTGVVFETTVNGWERFGSVASGGRYDNLASLFTDRKLPGVGASIGLDRLLALMEEAGWLTKNSTTVPVLVANFPGVDARVAFSLASRLRKADIGAEVFPEPIMVGKQMGYGSRRGHLFAVIVGPDEAEKGTFNLRDLATRQERKAIPMAELESAVAGALGVGS